MYLSSYHDICDIYHQNSMTEINSFDIYSWHKQLTYDTCQEIILPTTWKKSPSGWTTPEIILLNDLKTHQKWGLAFPMPLINSIETTRSMFKFIVWNGAVWVTVIGVYRWIIALKPSWNCLYPTLLSPFLRHVIWSTWHQRWEMNKRAAGFMRNMPRGSTILPVTGASMSSMVLSCRNNAAPSLIIRRATSSVTRPSRMKCCLSMSGFGFAFVSNTSWIVSLWLGGNGTAEITSRKYHEHW